MGRLWAICGAILVLAITLQSFSGPGFLSFDSPVASAQSGSCSNPSVTVSPPSVTAPGQVQVIADGFSSGSIVSISVRPPAGWSFASQVQPTAGSDCRAIGTINIEACSTCPSGTAAVTVSGTQSQHGPITLNGSFQLQSSGQQGGPTTQTSAPQSCSVSSASAVPSVVPQGGTTTFVANGYSPGTTVTLHINGPGSSNTTSAQANSLCQVAASINILMTDPPGVYEVLSSGTAWAPFAVGVAQPLNQRATFQVSGVAATPTPFGPTVTPTSSVICPSPSVRIASSALTRGQQTTYTGLGFRAGSSVTVMLEDPALSSSAVAFIADGQVGPATAACSVAGTFTVGPTVALGRYRLSLTGPNHLGLIVTARAEFDVVSDQAGVPTPTVLPFDTAPTATSGTVAGQPTATPFPTSQTQGPPAPVSIQQTINLVGGPTVPVVGQANTYDHVVRITNTSPRAMDADAIAALLDLLAAKLQGQGVNMSFTTDYADGSRIATTTANIGSAQARGSSVTWSGQLQSGESLELRTTLDFTPTTALSLNQPIRGQTVSVADTRGTTLSVAPPPPPQLPPAQRIVQPPPPPVDPITGPRYFSDTGFGIGDENIWTYFVRRGGVRTFGMPISRQFTLLGTQYQLFEKGMLTVDAAGSVSLVNLLEDPFLPYEYFGDLRLPSIDGNLIATAPDPASPNFGDLTQEFVAVNSPEQYDGKNTRFYSTFLGTVLYFDAFFLGPGDANLIPGFDLEVWGLPTSQASYHVVGFDVVPGGAPDGSDLITPILDANVVLLRFQRGVMQHNALTGSTAGAPLGQYLRAVIMGTVTDPELVAAASTSALWAQYNPNAVDFTDRPDDVPDTNLVLAFEPE